MRRIRWVCFSILVAQLPLVVLHFVNLWKYRPHYEFFPFVLAAGSWLIWKRWPRGRITHPAWSVALAWAMFAVGLMLSVVAVLLFSPALATVAFLIVLGGVLLTLTGSSCRGLLAPWLLWWLVVPPPVQMDGQLIRTMQHTTATMVSAILDWGGVEHLLSGYVFQLPDRELFVAEACSGIHSQLVLFAACLIFAVYQRRGLIATMLFVLASIFWSVVVNVTRVTIVVIAAAQFGIDLSAGWIHEALGFGLLGAGLVLLVSSDQLLQGLLAAVRNPEPDITPGRYYDTVAENEAEAGRDAPVTLDFFSRQWNRWVAITPPSATAQRQELVTKSSDTESSETKWFDRRHGRSLIPYVALGSVFVVLGAFQSVIVLIPKTELRVAELSATIEADWLPASLGRWQRDEYLAETRDRGSDEGMCSSIWVYSSRDARLRIQMDYPFVGWHELPQCYAARGWRLVTRKVVTPPVASAHGNFVEVEFAGPAGESGLLLFSLFDGAGVTVHPLTSDWQRKVARNPLLAKLTGSQEISTTQTTLQVQQFVTGNLLEADRQRLRHTFDDFRSCIHECWFNQKATSIDRKMSRLSAQQTERSLSGRHIPRLVR